MKRSLTYLCVISAIVLLVAFAATQAQTTAPASRPAREPATASAPAAPMADGTYLGTGQGFRGGVTVVVKIKDGRIDGAAIMKQSDDAAWFNRAKVLLKKIVDNQGTDGVDTISGATYSSRGILKGAAEAIQNARTAAATRAATAPAEK